MFRLIYEQRLHICTIQYTYTQAATLYKRRSNRGTRTHSYSSTQKRPSDSV